jgi:DNA-directed RNA polymerase II subunit RPB1
MVDRKLTMAYVASRIAETFQTDLFVIWSEDNLEKLIICYRVTGSADKEADGSAAIEENVFPPPPGKHDARLCRLYGVSRALISGVYVTITKEGNIDARSEKEWVLETDGMNLKTAVMCIEGVDLFAWLRGSIRCAWHRKRPFLRSRGALSSLTALKSTTATLPCFTM